MNSNDPRQKSPQETQSQSKTELDALCRQQQDASQAERDQEKYKILRDLEKDPDRVTVVIQDQLTYEDGQRLRKEVGYLLAKNVRHWTLDLSGLTFCDSATMGFCLMIQLLGRKINSQVCIRLIQDSQVHEVFRISRLERIMTLQFV